MNPDKNQILTSSLKSTLYILKTLVTRQEYLEFSKTLMQFVVKIEKQNVQEFDSQWKKIDTAIEKLKEDNKEIQKGDFDSLKAEILKKLSEVKNGVDGIGIDGKDGYTPVKGVDYFDGENGKDLEPLKAETARDLLETLKGDERLDVTAIKGIDKLATKKDLATMKPGLQGTNNGVTVRNITGENGVSVDNTNPEFPKVSSNTTFLDDRYVKKAGDTMGGALIAYAHEATGLIPQVSNSTYGTADSIDMTSMPVGTFYFKHEA